MTTSSSPVRGRALLMSTAAASFVLSAALVAGPADAANECGAQAGATVTCPGNTTFPNGITYTPTSDLTLITQSTDTVNGPISVTGTASNVTVTNAAAITTTANNAAGITASTTGAANAAVTTTGTITTSGAGSDGVDALTTGSGNAAVTVGTVDSTGAVTGTGDISAPGTGSAGAAAVAFGSGTSTITVNQKSTVSGDFGAVLGASPSSTVATSTLNNNGTITGATAGVYSVAGSGAAIINNNSTGTINGPIVLEGGLPGIGNTVNNAGTWNVNGDSSFGATGTTNVLNNTGTINVSAPPASGPATATANTVTFSRLSALNNAGGVIDLTKGESLNTGTAVFNGGTGSTLRVNANGGSGTLFIPSTGTGTTRVVLADIPPAHPAMNFNGETLVSGNAAGNGPAAGSFNFGTLPGGAPNNDAHEGFVDYRLVYTGATATTPADYTLFGLPGREVFEALNIPYALQNFWRGSANQATLRQQAIRDSMVGQHPTRPDGWEFWAQPYGGSDFYKRPDVYRFGGFSFGSIGNHNDTVGLQIGADALANWMGGHGYWGFTGGVEQQTTHFQFDDANDLYSVGGNFGMYGGMDWGGFYLNALGKVDWDNMNTNFFTAGFSPTNTYKAYGARAEAGYRWPWQGFYVEPSIRGNFIWTDGINLHPAGAALDFFDDEPVVDVQAGGRVGTTFNFGRIIPGAINPFPGEFNIFVGAWYADQWSGQNRMNFTTFGAAPRANPTTLTSINLFQLPMGQSIHMEYGLETADWFGGLKLFLKGENDFNGDSVGGWNASAGVRFSF